MRYGTKEFSDVCSRLDAGTATAEDALAYLQSPDISLNEMPAKALAVVVAALSAAASREAEMREARDTARNILRPTLVNRVVEWAMKATEQLTRWHSHECVLYGCVGGAKCGSQTPTTELIASARDLLGAAISPPQPREEGRS